MAKVVKSSYPYKSRFGSDSSMIEKEENGIITCKDEFGTYETTRNNIDSGLVDPNRTSSDRLKKLFSGKKEEK